jgi:hypothetical protein
MHAAFMAGLGVCRPGGAEQQALAEGGSEVPKLHFDDPNMFGHNLRLVKYLQSTGQSLSGGENKELRAFVEGLNPVCSATKPSAAPVTAPFDHNSKGAAELRFFFFPLFSPVSHVDLSSTRDVRLDRNTISALNTKQQIPQVQSQFARNHNFRMQKGAFSSSSGFA